MNDRSRILDKMKKCLALSASSNKHETGVALRQARKLMEAHGITDLDILSSRGQRMPRQVWCKEPSIGETCQRE